MKRYDFLYAEEVNESPDGQWVPAEVAQALYDALVVASSHIDTYDAESFGVVNKALSLADGESE